MFSYYNDGITDINPKKTIDLPGLVKIIKQNPNQLKIEKIRWLKSQDDDEYKQLKRSLSYITPNCILRKRSLDGDKFNKNFIQSSGYIYFDIDNLSNVLEKKEEFIKKYGNSVSLVSISSGGDGLSVLFRITNLINNQEQFKQIWLEIRNTILKDEKVDPNINDIGRAMFISYDPDIFYNYENEITIDICNTAPEITEKKGISQSISFKSVNNRLNDTFSNIPIDEVLQNISIKTQINNKSTVVDIIPVDYTSVNFPRVIQDGNKHRIYRGMIHSLVYLNPQLQVDYLFSYLNFINNNFAQPKMEFKKLVRLFNYEYHNIKNNKDYQYRSNRKKYIHFNPDCDLTGSEKRDVACKLNGQRRKNESIKKIIQAKEDLISQGKKVTQKSVSEFSGLSKITVKRYYNEDVLDLDEIKETLVDNISPNHIKPQFNSSNNFNTRTHFLIPGGTPGPQIQLFPQPIKSVPSN